VISARGSAGTATGRISSCSRWPDVSPTKWHLAHTTWFFETFVVKVWAQRYRSEVPQYAFLFNSYYNAAGTMHRRDLRGSDLAPDRC
jgi:hypothetical protein